MTLLFNSSGYHTIPVYLNAISNARLKRKNPGASIQLSSLPLPPTPTEKSRSSTFLALILGIAFAFAPASFAAYVIRELETQVFQQQLLASVTPTVYWISNWIWDFFSTLIPSYFCMIIVAAYGIDSLVGENAGPAILLLTLFSMAVCPFTYLLSYLFKDSNSGQNAILFVNIISVSALLIASLIMSFLDSTKDVNASLMYIYYLLPTYSMAYGILSLMSRTNGIVHKDIFDQDVLGMPLVYLACESVVYFVLLLMLEKIRSSPDLLARVMPHVKDPGLQQRDLVSDSDVEAEKARVKSGQADRDVIVLKGLRKIYPGPNGGIKVAIQDSWFGIPAGEIFGFLGVNGAGKTTTLQVLSGDVVPSSGTASLLGVDILKDQSRARRLIGYCPQFDALIHVMTARAHLEMYAAFKGIPRSKIKSTVQSLIEKLGLKQYADRPCGGYSGGNRRKLSVGMALIGDPPLVFLDEPSTGMDPGARRTKWDVIVNTMTGKSVILTTHSMEECEALCTRIAIQVSGRLACLGTAQHLKDKFGNGYQLEINAVEGRVDEVKQFVLNRFPGSEMLEEQSTNVKYRIKKTRSIGDMFRVVESETAGLVDSYSISDISLEQIFIYFASQQTEELGHVRGLAPMRIPSNPDLVVLIGEP